MPWWFVYANLAVCILALGGCALSLYFTLLYYHVIPVCSGNRPFCLACEKVVFTRFGRLFFLPNSVYGLGFYWIVLISALTQLVTGTTIEPYRAILLDAALLSAAVSVGTGLYLIYVLFVKLRVVCWLCLAGHTCNVLIALLLLWLKTN
jgi:uncharacterized membrane protein